MTDYDIAVDNSWMSDDPTLGAEAIDPMTTFQTQGRARLLVGPALLTLGVLVARGLLISRGLYGDHWRLIVLPLITGSISVLGAQGLLALTAYWLPMKPIRLALWFVSTLLTLLFIVETYVLLVFGVRLALIDVLKYGRSMELLVSAFIHTKELILFCAAIGVSLVTVQLARRWVYLFALAAIGCVVVGFIDQSHRNIVDVSRYDSNPFALLLGLSVKKHPEMPYTSKEISYYSTVDGANFRSYDIPQSKTPIIVLIIEGLSSADSLKTSGVYDRLKRFDNITNEGTLFTEFFANYWDSEGGLVSLLHGIPPFPFPGNTRLMTSSFNRAPSAISVFKNHGYYTELLAAFRLSWTNLSGYLQQIGFDRARGRDDVPSFIEAPKFTFDAPSDEVLYVETLKRVEELLKMDAPFLLFSLTISSHLPYTDPLGRRNTEENVWDYVDDAFVNFYSRLKQTGFLDKGILMVLGDHRKSGHITDPEMARYGVSAKARTPLAIFGKGVRKGRIDRRPFQQTDLLTSIPTMLEDNASLSKEVVFVERYTDFSVFKVQESGGFEVFDLENKAMTSFAGLVSGNALRWVGAEPPRAAELERKIHSWRSRLQRSRSEVGERCGEPLLDLGEPGDSVGVRVLRFQLTSISQQLTPNTPGFAGEAHSSHLSDLPLTSLTDGKTGDYTLAFHSFLKIDIPGLYWFRLGSDDGSCLFINSRLIVDANESKPFSYEDRRVFLDRGVWPLELRYFQGFGDAGLDLLWRTPFDDSWKPIPQDALIEPRPPI